MTRIAARELPELRNEALHGWERSVAAESITAGIEQHGFEYVYPTSLSPTQAGEWIAGAERKRLHLAELFHVSPEMTRLAKAASATLPHFDLDRHDLPCDFGLLVFAEPIVVMPPDDSHPVNEDIPIIGASWGLLADGPEWWGQGGIGLTFYSDLIDSPFRQSTCEKLRQLGRPDLLPPRLNFSDNAAWGFCAPGLDHVSAEEWRSEARDDLLSICGPILKATWLLMQQPLAAMSRLDPDRSTLRRCLRQREIAAPVRLITLRRTSAEEAGSGTERDYHHRWVVSGHWRNQWLPSRGVHRPTWINAHIKGPEGAPLLTGEKVHAWRR